MLHRHFFLGPILSLDANAVSVELVNVVAPMCRLVTMRAGHASGTSELQKLPSMPALVVDLNLDVIQVRLPVIHDLWRVSSQSFTT